MMGGMAEGEGGKGRSDLENENQRKKPCPLLLPTSTVVPRRFPSKALGNIIDQIWGSATSQTTGIQAVVHDSSERYATMA